MCEFTRVASTFLPRDSSVDDVGEPHHRAPLQAYRSAEADKDDKVGWEKDKAPIKATPNIRPQFNRHKFGEAKRPELFQNMAYARATQNLTFKRDGNLGWSGRSKTSTDQRLHCVPGDPGHAEYPGPGDVEVRWARRVKILYNFISSVLLDSWAGLAT